jgi:hypothetical protein
MVDFAAAIKDAEKAGLLGGGDYLKLKAGDNRFRLMSECLPHEGEYQGRPNFKWLCYVLDRAEGKIKLFFMPHRIYKQIAQLQKSEDYAFTEVPMPYDLTIGADAKVGTKDVTYTLTPARKNSELTTAELKAWAEVKPLKEVQKALFEKNAKGGGSVPHDDAPPHSDDDN